ncbi:MAG: GntR family transcriptional regulator [Lachnospira sp.]|nr:GntR family transcriptional regulator [Lachnospira sp.]
MRQGCCNLESANMNQKKISQEYEKAIEYIYELMKSGELTIGSRLPTERALAETLGIGRNSTREALSIMHGMGLIERRQGSGNYISENVGQSIKQTILMMIALKTITKREVCEFRRMMEKSVCNAVIHTGLTKEQQERLESMVNQMSLVTGDNLVDTDKAFHEELIADTGNNLWITLMEAVVEVYREWIDYVIKHADGIMKNKLLKTHEMIYDSLIKKDIETLNAAIDEHYDIIEELLG